MEFSWHPMSWYLDVWELLQKQKAGHGKPNTAMKSDDFLELVFRDHSTVDI